MDKSIEINREKEMDEDDVEDMELGELDLDAIEKECEKAGKGYVSCKKVELL